MNIIARHFASAFLWLLGTSGALTAEPAVMFQNDWKQDSYISAMVAKSGKTIANTRHDSLRLNNLWEIKRVPKDLKSFYILHRASGLYLTGRSPNVVLRSFRGLESQRWRFHYAGKGNQFRIENLINWDHFLHLQSENLELGLIDNNWASALWNLERGDVQGDEWSDLIGTLLRPVPVTLYSGCDYSGKSVELGYGPYHLTDLVNQGMPNDTVSSVRVGKGAQVTLFEHQKFKGSKIHLLADRKCLIRNDFNDKLSSLLVRERQDYTLSKAALSGDTKKLVIQLDALIVQERIEHSSDDIILEISADPYTNITRLPPISTDPSCAFNCFPSMEMNEDNVATKVWSICHRASPEPFLHVTVKDRDAPATIGDEGNLAHPAAGAIGSASIPVVGQALGRKSIEIVDGPGRYILTFSVARRESELPECNPSEVRWEAHGRSWRDSGWGGVSRECETKCDNASGNSVGRCSVEANEACSQAAIALLGCIAICEATK